MAETVAVKVTAWPNTEGSVAETTEVVVFAWLTTWLKAVDALEVKLASPPYDTVIDWVATPRLEVVRLALPLLKVAVPSKLEPSLKVTVPVGVPPPSCRGRDRGREGDGLAEHRGVGRRRDRGGRGVLGDGLGQD